MIKLMLMCCFLGLSVVLSGDDPVFSDNPSKGGILIEDDTTPRDYRNLLQGQPADSYGRTFVNPRIQDDGSPVAATRNSNVNETSAQRRGFGSLARSIKRRSDNGKQAGTLSFRSLSDRVKRQQEESKPDSVSSNRQLSKAKKEAPRRKSFF